MHREIKKALLSTVALLLCTACFAAVILYPKEYVFDQDHENETRRALDGTLELLISGASQGRCGFDTAIMDEELGVKCYSLTKGGMNMIARYFTLDKELKANPVKTVVIEISSDALQRNREEENYENNRQVWEGLDTFMEKVRFFRLQKITMKELGKIFSQSLENGLKGWALILRKELYADDGAQVEMERGELPYYQAGSHEVTLSKEAFMESYRGTDQQSAYPLREENCNYLNKCIEAGKAKGARVILCRVPESEVRALTFGVLEDLDAYLEALADSYQCEYYNFELIRDRAELLPERFAFLNDGHLNPSGAKTFTELFCEVIQSDHPEEYFWDTYEEAALHGSYAEWVKEIEAEKGGAPGAQANGEEQGQDI